jgi:hypothetical protein
VRTGVTSRGRTLALSLLAIGAACGSPEVELADVSSEVVVARGASNPTVAVAEDDGAAYVAWVGTEGEESNVFVARGRPDGGFAESVRVNDRPGDAAPHAQAPAQVAVGPDGAVYVVWQNNTTVEGRRFPASDLRFARSTDGGRTFELAIYVNDDAGGPPTSHTFHDMAVAADGTVYVSWIDGRARTSAEGPSAFGGGGHAAHHGAGDAGPQIRIARSTDGGRTFGASHVVDDEACPCCRTSLALGPDGEVWVAWRKVFEGSVRDVVVARSVDGGRTFSPPVRVHADGWAIEACPHAGPAVAVDRAGRVHVAWFTGAEGRAGAYHATSETGEAFGDPSPLTPVGGVPTTQVAMAADEDGSVWVAWEDPEGDTPALRLARVGEDGEPRPVDAEAVTGLLPSLAASADRVLLAWLDGERIEVMKAHVADR